MASPEPVITKRRVTMRSIVALPNGEIATHESTDYVPPEILDAYVADARKRWQVVETSDEPDAGPGGYDGATYIPADLPVADAGTYYPPTPGSDAEAALANPVTPDEEV